MSSSTPTTAGTADRVRGRITGTDIVDLWHGFDRAGDTVPRAEVYTTRAQYAHMGEPSRAYMECNYARGRTLTERWVCHPADLDNVRAELAALGYTVTTAEASR